MKSDPETGHLLNDEQVGCHPNARRRLLRGSFAAPSVLALSSGSALAASSSLRCFNNAPSGVNDPPANYFRVQRYTSNSTNVVMSADIAAVGNPKGIVSATYIGTKVWINVTTGAEFVPVGEPTKDTGYFVALRLTNIGTDAAPVFSVSGLALDSSLGNGPGKVMTGSCWSSFRPAP